MMPSTKQESRNQVSTFRRLIHNNESFISVNSSWKVWGLKQVSHSKTTSFVNVVLPSLRYFDLTNYFILCKTVCVVDNVMSYRCLLVWPMPVMVQVFKSGTINKKKKKFVYNCVLVILLIIILSSPAIINVWHSCKWQSFGK